MAAGARSFTAIAEWAADSPQQVLSLLGVRRQPRTGGFRLPDEATIRRVLTRPDGDNLDSAISVWLRAHPAGEDDAAPEVVAVDGKSLRGTYPPIPSVAVCISGRADPRDRDDHRSAAGSPRHQ
ncbi:transposase family protein [Saccharopolyspora hattusasensis]|uniref:transposase family protein n=1 Tax=Saccharopolyspora hattusasensis TaxID=1128679 RepID=UPI003D979BEA